MSTEQQQPEQEQQDQKPTIKVRSLERIRRHRKKIIAGAVAGSLAFGTSAFAAWVLTASVNANITRQAASVELEGVTCTTEGAATDVVLPGAQIATCTFRSTTNTGDAAAQDITNYTVQATGTNVSSPEPGTLAFSKQDMGRWQITVPVFAGNDGTDVRLTKVTLTYTP